MVFTVLRPRRVFSFERGVGEPVGCGNSVAADLQAVGYPLDAPRGR
jgi:hypothetical protein